MIDLYPSNLLTHNTTLSLEKLSHDVQKKPSDSSVLRRIQEIFCRTIQVTQTVFARVWDQAHLMGRIEWPVRGPLTKNRLELMERALRDTLVYHGKGCRVEPTSCAHPQMQGLLLYLLGRDTLVKLDNTVLRAIYVTKNPTLLRAMRQELTHILAACAKCLPAVGSPEETVFQAFVGSCLSLLPYTYPEGGEEFSIPQKVDGEWKMCQYTVDKPLALTPNGLLSPLFAFGLTSKSAPPILTIIGTTYPAGDGYFSSILSDFTPGLSVGHAPYFFGREKIRQWLEGKSQVRLYGSSLGGALCFQVLRHHRDKIGEVNAFNPPGLYPWNWGGPFETQKVNIYYQDNDLVASMGMFPKGPNVSVYRVLGPRTENFVSAHMRGYSGGDVVTILKSSPEYENRRPLRLFLTATHFIGGLTIGVVLLVTIIALSTLGIRKLFGTEPKSGAGVPFQIQKSLAPTTHRT